MKLFLWVCLLLLGFSAVGQFRKQIDSLESILPGADNDEKGVILGRLSELYQAVDIQKSIAYDLQNLEIQRQLNLQSKQSDLLNDLGISHYMIGDYAGAMGYFEQSLALRRQFQDTLNVVKTLNNLGVISQIIGDFDKALEYLQQSLIYKIQLNDTLSTAKTLNNIGVIYKDAQKHEVARQFLEQALEKYLAVNDSSGIAAAHNNLGQVYEAIGIADSALLFFEQSLDIKRKIGDRRGIANTLNNIGMIYGDQGKSAEALQYFAEAVEIRRELSDQFGLASVLNNMANLYLMRDDYEMALRFFRKSTEIAEAANLTGIRMRNYAGLSAYFEETGTVDSSLRYLKLATAIKDSIYNQDLKESLADLRIRYETEKSNRENKILLQKNEIQQLQIENDKKQKMQFVAVIFLLFFGSITVVLYLQYRYNRRMNERLQVVNAGLEARVKARTAELEESNQTRDRFFSIVAHDLKSPFNSLLGFTEILNDDYDRMGDYKKRELIRYLRESAESVYRLLENLLEWSSAQTGRMQLKPRRIELCRLAHETMAAATSIAHNKKISLKQQCDSEVYTFADEDTIRTVFRNLLSNAIKFTDRNGSVVVSVNTIRDESGKHWARVAVSDTGTGIREEDQGRLFDLTNNKPASGTDNETGTGLGLPLCRDFIRLNGGSIHVESTWGNGSTFYFILPAILLKS
ncbi:MAG: tetratricopeptide repeat protein [Bacteroidales bacterium]